MDGAESVSTNGHKRACLQCGSDLTDTHWKRIFCSDRCRKDYRYAGVCTDCGGPTDGKKSGFSRNPTRCRGCMETRNWERNSRLRVLWEEGRTAGYIAEQLGMSEGAVSTWVQKQRKHHEDDLPLHRLGGDAEERKVRHRQMIEWRREGKNNTEIADLSGMSSAASVSVCFAGLRQKGWDVPSAPRRVYA